MIGSTLLPPSLTERTIALARVALASASLFAVWMDPAEPARYVTPTYMLHVIYVIYSLVLAAIMWRHSGTGRLPLATQGADILISSMFQYLTLGPSSPFFMYFIFSLFCAALRWGWRGTLWTSFVVMASFLVMCAIMSRTLGPTEFELNRFIIRTVYLAVVGSLLVYLGQHEVRLRNEIEQLARWPTPEGPESGTELERVLGHAARMIGAGRVVVAWEAGEEPWVRVATWADSRLTVTRHPPGAIEPIVPGPLAHSVILCTGPLNDTTVSLVTGGGGPSKWHGLPLHTALRAQLSGGGLASAPFDTEHVTGRAFFSDLGEPTAESSVLTQVIARAIGTSIGHLHLSQQLRDIGAREQRIQLARDLHDGVLQSLTGVRLELQAVAGSLDHDAGSVGRERVLAVERALAVEQRELRLFIQGLRPPVTVVPDGTTLASRLQDVRERVLLEWKVPVTIRLDPRPIRLSAALEQALPLMAHEAIVNALKHAQPSRISVDVNPDGNSVRLVVADDGAGFAVQGRYDHEALLKMNLGPVSLRERAASLGGRMSIESTGAGSRVEIILPMAAGAA